MKEDIYNLIVIFKHRIKQNIDCLQLWHSRVEDIWGEDILCTLFAHVVILTEQNLFTNCSRECSMDYTIFKQFFV